MPTLTRQTAPARRATWRLALALALALAAITAAPVAASGATGGIAAESDSSGSSGPAGDATALQGNAMWIWYLSKAEGGGLNAIANRAHASNVDTVFVKSGDGSNYWSQFTSALVDGLHARGLKVCAWQFMYGSQARQEAEVGAKAVRRGADCLIMDPESAFEGRYKQADRYIRRLRSRIDNNDYPLGLASFPYVHFHPALPYSVFLRSDDGAQFNLPQMYWKAIGTTTENVYSVTYRHNRPYGRPILPLGQTFGSPSETDVRQFRRWGLEYDAGGLSWWSWQHTSPSEWEWVGDPVSEFPDKQPDSSWANLSSGSKGDQVIWAQSHLVGAGYSVKIDGGFGNGMRDKVQAYQAARGLTADGVIGRVTWLALLEEEACDWLWGSSTPRCDDRDVTSGAAATGSAGQADDPAQPSTSSLPARRYEIPTDLKR